MGEPVIIAAAVVGAEVRREQNPAVPYTPAEIAAAAVAAGKAGAAVVHLHARWPDGRASQEAAHFQEIVDRIRAAGSDLVLQCSTGGAVGMGIEERLGALVPGAEMGTLNMGTMNFGDEAWSRSARSTTPACSTPWPGSSRRATWPSPTTCSSCSASPAA
jgi:3-keto-5-aminohexanoate cleavage enzyme